MRQSGDCGVGDEVWGRPPAEFDTLAFTLLKTVGATGHDRELPITSRKVRTVLAVLLLAADRSVHVDDLVDQVWAEQPPISAVKNLQMYIHRLRMLFDTGAAGASRLLSRTPDGYRLSTPAASIDLQVAESLVLRAEQCRRRGELAEAAGQLDRALAGWSEHPVGGVTCSTMLVAAAQQLRDRRLDLLERRSEFDIELGKYPAAVERLHPLVAANPFREHLQVLMITALGRDGRRADAIALFHQLRHRLSEEFAISPGPAAMAAYQEVIGDWSQTPQSKPMKVG
ncbi:MAG: AfsR/SARP family transcriptional regulator [Actinomycetota bacterium]|nr:AfsR/SARP family transcriptional regulator [Actinomycetota bacterium]